MPRSGRRGFGDELVDEPIDEVERGVAVAAVDRQLDDAANLAAEVDERAREDALAQVEPDDLAGVADDAEQDRGLAAARGSATDLLDHALVEQLADDVADRRPRQAGAAGDLGAADRPEVVEGPQHQALVVLRASAGGSPWPGVASARSPSLGSSVRPRSSAGTLPKDWTKRRMRRGSGNVKCLDKAKRPENCRPCGHPGHHFRGWASAVAGSSR